MKALILNSGIGRRMGELTSEHPKCMTVISKDETILSRQLNLLLQCGINEIIITTGLFDKILVEYCNSLKLPLKYIFVNNPVYEETNYIYSIYLAKYCLDDDVIIMHGDLVFELSVLYNIINNKNSCMTVSSTMPLPLKDFKAVVKKELIEKIGVEYFEDAVTAQPLYKIFLKDWKVWLKRIEEFCENGKVNCYAENAFNEVSSLCHIYPMDFENSLCAEIDTPEDLLLIVNRLFELDKK